MKNVKRLVLNPPSERPLLVYDADCSFCRRWVMRLRAWVGENIQYRPFQEVYTAYPEIPLESFKRAVQFIETDGTVSEGAEAIFRALAVSPDWRWYLWFYEYLPGFSLFSEFFYRLVANHRPLFDKWMTWTFGRSHAPATYFLSRWIFLRLLAIIYLVAFFSFWMQMDGLVGSRGIEPAGDYLHSIAQRTGAERYYRLPTIFWLNSSDAMLHAVCLSGVATSILMLLDFAPVICLAWMWFAYLSIVNTGREFMQYQWDVLLLETGFLAIFFAPLGWRTRIQSVKKPSRVILLLFWWLLFRLMFSSGFVKLGSGDPTWWSLTALQYHYETQPLPTAIGWYVHQLPAQVHTFSAICMFLIELLVPFLIFTPRRLRLVGAMLLSLLQILILLTGNYGFFNLLSLALILLLIDDVYWQKCLPSGLTAKWAGILQRSSEPVWKKIGAGSIAALVIISSLVQLHWTVHRNRELPGFMLAIDEWASPFMIANNYGLFAVMTITRPEIVVEGSMDGENWQAYEFKWKAGALDKRPEFVEPHMPRLDWQMWFAALGNYRQNPWFLSFMERLLLGEPKVLALLENNPFPDRPPKYVWALLYEYHFTRLGTPVAQNQWWKRERLGDYCPVMALREPGTEV